MYSSLLSIWVLFLSFFTVASPFPAGVAVAGCLFSAMPVIGQGVQSFIDFKYQFTASSAVAAVRTAVGNIELPPEAAVSVTALPGTDIDFCSVCKHNFSFIIMMEKPQTLRSGA
mgnify:CR=1 FL=1